MQIYTEVFGTTRTPERAEQLLRAVSLLSDNGYEEKLNELYGLSSTLSTAEEVANRGELLILTCMSDICGRLGLGIDGSNIYRYIRQTIDLVETLVVDIDSWEDYESMLAIFDSGEPYNIALANLSSYIRNVDTSIYIEILDFVSDRTAKSIIDVLSARIVKNENVEAPAAVIRRLKQFMETFPSTVLTELFACSGYMQSLNQLMAGITIPVDSFNTEDSLYDYIAVVSAGLLCVQDIEYDAAYELLEIVVPALLDGDDQDDVITITHRADKILRSLYGLTNHG